MDCQISRRQMLRFLTVVLPAGLLGYKTIDYFEKELVCVHVYGIPLGLPEPLLEVKKRLGPRSNRTTYFQIGLPELILCRTEKPLLDMFEYFWPVTRMDIRRFRDVSTMLFSLPRLESGEQLIKLERFLMKHKGMKKTWEGSLAVLLTLNAYTQNACGRLIKICTDKGIDELVIFKDPSKPPYLCGYPSQQKGFKKKPPVGANFVSGEGVV